MTTTAPVTVSVHDVAAELRAQRPGCSVTKLHALLYYCQGHHLAWFGEPLFEDVIEAWGVGPVVPTLWYAEKNGDPPAHRGRLGNRERNTVGYVVSRYGNLTATDLTILTTNEEPWRRAGEGHRIGHTSLVEYFATNNTADENTGLDRATVAAWLKNTAARPDQRGRGLTREQMVAEFAARETEQG